MSKGRLVLAAAALIAIVVGLLLWRRHTESSTRAAVPTSKTSTVSVAWGGADPTTGVPRWFGQSGIAARRIAGIVVGEDGAPVPGAIVRLSNAFTRAGLVRAPSKVTDGAGRFDFGAQPATAYVVTAEAPKLTAALQAIDLRRLAPVDNLKLVLHTCIASIHGTIYDTAGGTIGGATLLRSAESVTSAGVTAGDDGRYELCVPPGGAGVLISADGYANLQDRIDVYGRTRRDFWLIPGTIVVGRVIRAADRSPVAGALVELRSTDPRARQSPLTAASGADGRFEIDGVAPGRYNVTALADRLATAHPVEAIAELGGQSADVVCELSEALTVAGKVVVRGTSTPAAGRIVFLFDGSRRARFDMPRQLYATSQTDGTFTIDHVPRGEYRPIIEIGEGGKPGQALKVEDKDITGLVLEVDPDASIAGRVLSGGKPVDGAMVRVTGESFAKFTTSDADGGYALEGLQAGTYRVYSEAQRVGAFTQGPQVTLAQGEHKTGVDVELDLAGSISGVVVDQNDQAVGGVFLSFTLLRGSDYGNATTADDGSFTARSLSGGGDYGYEVRQRDQSAIVYPPAVGKRHPPVPVKDGRTHVTGVRVKIRYERLAIAGRVVDSDGKPVADVNVSASQKEERWYRVPSATTDQNGAFALRDLPAGTYAVVAASVKGEGRVESVAAGRTDVVVRLLGAGGIDGTLQGFTKPPDVAAYRIDDRYNRYRATVTGTTFQLRNLPPGRYRLSARAGVEVAGAAVTIEPASIKAVTIKVTDVGTVIGTVIDAKTRAPVAGVHCISGLRDDDMIDMDGPHSSVTTDATGTFKMDRAPAGPSMVGCMGNGASGWVQATVNVGQVTRVEVAMRIGDPDEDDTRSGLTLDDQLDDVYVELIEPNSPATRAGIVVGDVVVSVDGEKIGREQSDHALSLIEAAGKTEVKLVLERNDKQLTVVLELDPAAK